MIRTVIALALIIAPVAPLSGPQPCIRATWERRQAEIVMTFKDLNKRSDDIRGRSAALLKELQGVLSPERTASMKNEIRRLAADTRSVGVEIGILNIRADQLRKEINNHDADYGPAIRHPFVLVAPRMPLPGRFPPR